jgi:hypothetical protein
LRKEILLLPGYLLNSNCGDVICTDSNDTNDHTNKDLQEFPRDLNTVQEDAEDPGVFLQLDSPAGSGVRS